MATYDKYVVRKDLIASKIVYMYISNIRCLSHFKLSIKFHNNQKNNDNNNNAS